MELITKALIKFFKMKNILGNLIFSDNKPAIFSIRKSDRIHYLAIGLLEGQLLKKHKANVPTTLTVIKGSIQFFINEEVLFLTEYDTFEIPVGVEHEVKGLGGENVFTLIQEKKVDRS